MSSSGKEYNHMLLEEQVCFALYAASRAVTDVYRSVLADLGLTYPQYLVLLVLWERDNRPVKEIGAALQLDYGTMSPLLKRLEANGLVERHRFARDERTVVVSLTEKGAALKDRAAGVPAKIGGALGLNAGQRRELITTLRQMTAAVEEYSGGITNAQP